MPSAAWIGGISDAGSPAPILSEGTQLAYVQPQKPENFPEVPEVERLKSLVAQFKTELGPSHQAWKAKAESITNAEDAKLLSRRVIERAYQVHQPQSFLNGTVAENFNALQETVDEAKLAVFDRSSGYGLGGVVVAGAVGTVIDITVPTSAWDLVPGGKLASKARKLMKAGLDKGEQFVRVQMSQMEWLK